MKVENRSALVTGSNRGIGKAIVRSLLDQGVKKVYAAARRIDSMPDFNDPRVIPIALDISNKKDIEQAVKSASDIDLLINNAGVAAFTSVVDGDLELIQRDMDVNYYGTLNMCRAFIPVLGKNESSSIVNMVTIGAFVNFPILGGYCASKSALFSLSQGLRIELSSQNISVHTVNPGPIDTDMAKDFPGEKYNPQDTANAIIQNLKNGQEDIFPDPVGAEMFSVWQKDYRQLEDMVFNMHHSN